MENLSHLLAREEELARVWVALNETVNDVAEAMLDAPNATAFRLIYEQARSVGQRRVELMLQIAAAERLGMGASAVPPTS
jgi:hypothetical protein